MNNLNEAINADRLNIGFFGLRNAGKSSLVNAITNQEMSIVSDLKGTTNDPVKKAMEILPLGPVVIIDTAGYDDEDEKLSERRIEKTKEIINKTDIAILTIDALEFDEKLVFKDDINIEYINNQINKNKYLSELINIFKEKNIIYITALNKCDNFYGKYKNLIDEFNKKHRYDMLWTSAVDKEKTEDLKNFLASIKIVNKNNSLVEKIVKENDFVILVTPIDESAPKGRLILPQVKTLRDILDKNAYALTVKEKQLKNALEKINRKPDLVITDSQVFDYVDNILPKDVKLTSFSILLARQKNFLDTAISSVKKIKDLKDGDTILISEACTHHRKCNDIGAVQIPKILKQITNKNLNIEMTSGYDFAKYLSKYKMIIHCGGCMISDKEMKSRIDRAKSENVLFTNYGIFLAYAKGILDRSVEIFKR